MNGHALEGSYWCAPVTETLPDGRQIEKHNTTFLEIREAVIDPAL